MGTPVAGVLRSVPSTENLIAVAPVAAASKQARPAPHDVDAVVIVGAGLAVPSITSDWVGRPMTAPEELSIAASVTLPARRPVHVTVIRTCLRSSGWLSAGEVAVPAWQNAGVDVVAVPSFGSSTEQTVAVIE